MKAKQTNRSSRVLILTIIAIMCVVLAFCVGIMLTEYNSNLADQAATKAQLFASKAGISLNGVLNGKINEVRLAAESLSKGSYLSEDDFNSSLRALAAEDRFKDALIFRYFRAGTEYSKDGTAYTLPEDPAITRLVNEKKSGCAGYVLDAENTTNLMAICVPVKGCVYMDNLVVFYPEAALGAYEGDENEDYIDKAIFFGVCADSGEVVRLYKTAGTGVELHNSVFDFLKKQINNAEAMSEITDIIVKGENGSVAVDINGETFVVAVGAEGVSNGKFSAIGLYRALDLYNTGYELMTTILTVMIIFLLAMLILAVSFIVISKKHDRALVTMRDKDEVLGCPTRRRFEREVPEILERNKATSFAVVTIEIKHFAYFRSQLDQDSVQKFMRALTDMLTRACRKDEMMCYLEHGVFAILLHYKDKAEFERRLDTLIGVMKSYKGNVPPNYRLEFLGGVYETGMETGMSAQRMLELSGEARSLSVTEPDFSSFTYFKENMKRDRALEEYIELNMEKALANKNYLVFYQPKYNLATHTIDSSEALVRWYNPERDEYMIPAVFMPLFESNGFIATLDRYVLELVCDYIEDSVKGQRRVYPVAVNVSRTTAMQPDFADTYIAIRKKHHVSAGFITLEFAENAGFGNDERFAETLMKLRMNGFKCAVDHFGSGESSFHILKNLPVDEIKLDALFMDNALENSRDRKVLERTIGIAHELNLKVTQEGVETRKQYDMLAGFGCNVIQGFFYSKPLIMSDYVGFMESGQSNLSTRL